MNRTFKAAVAALIFAVGFAGSVAAETLEDAFAAVGGPYEKALAASKKGDYATAARLLRPLAEQADPRAQIILGRMYRDGRGVTQDYEEAMSLLRDPAERGWPDAQTGLGLMYAKGEGVPQDYVVAHMWLNLAAAEGDKTAAQVRNWLAARMTLAQVAEAQKLAREWKPK
jgi:uncharacterized protein